MEVVDEENCLLSGEATKHLSKASTIWINKITQRDGMFIALIWLSEHKRIAKKLSRNNKVGECKQRKNA